MIFFQIYTGAIVWRNKYDPTQSGQNIDGPSANQNSAQDFREFYNSSFTLFSKDLPDSYSLAE